MMKKIIRFMAVFSFLVASEDGYEMIKVIEGATSSNASKEIHIPEEKRPAGFIIREAKDEQIVFNEAGKVLDKDGNIKLIRLHVNFDFDRYNLKDEYKDEIAQAVKFIKENPTLSISVDGHTDSDGTEQYNQILSEKRANTVTQRLVEQGVTKESIVSKGYGELKPIVPNTTEENKALNRRVDISFNK
jgi:OOP family OmpA-OmpF porin